MSKVRRVYVEKKEDYQIAGGDLKKEINRYLDIKSLTNVRILVRYDVENISDETFKKASHTVFSEPPVDYLYENEFPHEDSDRIFSVEYLPGQFDQRADSAEQCVKLLNESEQPVIKSATTYVLSGDITEEEFDRIKSYCINPVDSRLTDEVVPDTLVTVFDEPDDISIFEGFTDMDVAELNKLYESLGLAMTFKDFCHIQNYYKNEEKRDPAFTEIKVLDTYWSDHCRHTTFLTELKNIEFEDSYYTKPVKESFEAYKKAYSEIYADRDDKYVSLMDIALMAMKKLKADGKLADMEESDEINACSIIVPVEIDGKEEEWLVFFKNETHNHPTEIEPFGGAATCLGGAIRDPLSGRGYVYQAMRVTGAADPTVSLKDTLDGKLPQRKITTGAASGYSSYGNQIGLATGLVNEVYHPNYVAKRMEIGAVMGAAPRKPTIVYDRHQASVTRIKMSEIPEDIYHSARMFHTSGISLALCQNMQNVAVELIRRFKSAGATISFDVNYRANLWGEEEARKTIEEILPLVDVLFVSEETSRRMFKKTGDLKDIMKSYATDYGVKIVATTQRTVISPRKHNFTSIVYDARSDKFYTETPYNDIDVIDRIGSGDAYVAGVLFGLLKYGDPEKAMQFGNATSSVKNTVPGDLPSSDFKEIDRIIHEHHSTGPVSEMNR